VIVAMHRRTALIALVTAGLIVLACLPAVVTFGLGWLPLPHFQVAGVPPTKDTSTLEGWTAFALFYLAWMAGLTVLLVWCFDRIGHKWHYNERSTRPKKKERRRARATMQAVNAERQASIEAMRRREAREAQRRRSRESHHARNDRGG
jgi:type VI protein secretion system component VasK